MSRNQHFLSLQYMKKDSTNPLLENLGLSMDLLTPTLTVTD
jgi:hypothetical protein